NRWSEQCVVADGHPAHIEHDAVEVEKHPLSKLDVRPVIAVKRRLHPDGLPACSEELLAEIPSYLLIAFTGSIQRLAQIARAVSRRHQIRIQCIVELARQHLLALSSHPQFLTAPESQ